MMRNTTIGHITGSRRTPWSAFATLAGALVASGCVQVDPKPDFERARKLVTESTGRSAVFDPAAPVLTEKQLDGILADGLSLDEALRLALTNNRELQAAFQEIGVAHADWAQSRMLSNPSLEGLLKIPTDGGRGVLEGLLSFVLLDLWRVPPRAKAARHDLDATVLRIARRAGEHLAVARQAYYAAVAADALLQVASENITLADQSFGVVKARHEAGSADALDESLARGPWLTAQLAQRRARIAAANARRELAKALSVARSVEGLALTDGLPGIEQRRHDPEKLVRQAVASRLDLQAVAAAIRALESRARLESRKAWGDVTVGGTVEGPTGSDGWLLGPSLSLTLLLFDQNQAQLAKAGFKLEQMKKLYEAARTAIAQDVRSSADRARAAADNLAFFAREWLPHAERSVVLARESYTAGRSTLLALVEVQRQHLSARRELVALQLEAAGAAAELERVVGAPGRRLGRE